MSEQTSLSLRLREHLNLIKGGTELILFRDGSRIMFVTLPASGEYAVEKVICEEVVLALVFLTNRDSLSVCWAL